MLRTAAIALALLVATVTALPFLRARAWWIRVWEFPRLQLAALALVAAGGVAATDGGAWPLVVALAAAAYQLALVWRYTPLAPREVHRASTEGGDAMLRLAMGNVLQSNRDARRLIDVFRALDADVMVFVETDAWWHEQLDPVFRSSHPHGAAQPQGNTYGMLVYSRLPMENVTVAFLIEADVPSVHARLILRNGTGVGFHAVHPRPPAPGEAEDSTVRDAELLVVGRHVRDDPGPSIVCGDLNDVAWSRTTRLFQKVSRLVDPRKGRGMFATFHAKLPGLRYPLDHVFHSDDFRLVEMKRLPFVGSDHFPICVTLRHEPEAAADQEAPADGPGDLEEVHDAAAEAGADAPRVPGA